MDNGEQEVSQLVSAHLYGLLQEEGWTRMATERMGLAVPTCHSAQREKSRLPDFNE